MEVRERELERFPGLKWAGTVWIGFGSLFLPPHSGLAKTVCSRHALLTP